MSEDTPPEGGAADPLAVAAELRARHAEYWRRNIRYVAVLLVVWFTVSYGFGILLVEPLNRLALPGTSFPLGFWFAQQGSIYVFVVLIFVYVWLMNRLDREFDVDEGDVVAGARGTGAARAEAEAARDEPPPTDTPGTRGPGRADEQGDAWRPGAPEGGRP